MGLAVMKPSAIYYFPRGFLWGTATSSHQVEGSNVNNNWAAWENQPGRILDNSRAGLACNWWGGKWREDFDRAADAGQNAHRLSIEWSRVQPTPDHWDEDALEFYRRVVRGLVERKMTPLVTLHHFTDPLWLVEQGGWENEETPQRFARYVRKVVEALKEYVTLWVTINEPNVYIWGGWLGGGFPPGKNDLKLAFRVAGNLLRAHALAYQAIHAVQPQARVGLAHHWRGFDPARRWFPPDHWTARLLFESFSAAFPRAVTDGKLRFALRTLRVPEAAGTQDFFGLNYYASDLVAFTPFAKLFHRRFYPPDVEVSPSGMFANMPQGMFAALKWAKSFRLPILITENGIEDAEDALRPRFLLQNLHAVWRAITFSFPVKGYFHWTLVDNFEWERGWTQRFGLWGLDLQTQARIPRLSARLYAAICKENGIRAETVEQFAPEVYEKLYPG
jgi:beta-glucosidase